MGFANVRAGTQKRCGSTRVPFCIARCSQVHAAPKSLSSVQCYWPIADNAKGSEPGVAVLGEWLEEVLPTVARPEHNPRRALCVAHA